MMTMKNIMNRRMTKNSKIMIKMRMMISKDKKVKTMPRKRMNTLMTKPKIRRMMTKGMKMNMRKMILMRPTKEMMRNLIRHRRKPIRKRRNRMRMQQIYHDLIITYCSTKS
jgi:hypothetical protein